jgi:acyl-CoA thioesterase YciA
MRITVEAWSQHYSDDSQRLVTKGVFTYVAIDDEGRPHPARRG